jgi:ribosomal-protein-serine acetyltransferase
MASSRSQILEGRRVQLRPLEASDAEELFAAIEASRDVLKRRLQWVGAVATVADEKSFISEVRGKHVWAVQETKSGKVVGVSSLEAFEEPQSGQFKFALWIRADRQDRGYGTEVGKLLVEQAFRRLGAHRISARMDPANRSFRRVLKKLGFRYEGCLRDACRLNGRWVDQECWGMLKTERKK